MTEKMSVLGITGGVGCGKSTVLEYLKKQYAARIILCDDVARRLQLPGQACYLPMLELFGSDCLLPDGCFDRGKVAALVFQDPGLLKKLNRIVHPAVKCWVKEELERLGKEGETRLIAIEAALLLEEHYELLCHEIWYIYAPEPVRRRRLAASRGYTEEKITQIMEAQLPDGYFREHCQFVVDNSSDNVENTYEQIDKGLKEHGIL